MDAMDQAAPTHAKSVLEWSSGVVERCEVGALMREASALESVIVCIWRKCKASG
jgi:hypothetical protein